MVCSIQKKQLQGKSCSGLTFWGTTCPETEFLEAQLLDSKQCLLSGSTEIFQRLRNWPKWVVSHKNGNKYIPYNRRIPLAPPNFKYFFHRTEALALLNKMLVKHFLEIRQNKIFLSNFVLEMTKLFLLQLNKQKRKSEACKLSLQIIYT